jgi:hypothetical protein
MGSSLTTSRLVALSSASGDKLNGTTLLQLPSLADPEPQESCDVAAVAMPNRCGSWRDPGDVTLDTSRYACEIYSWSSFCPPRKTMGQNGTLNTVGHNRFFKTGGCPFGSGREGISVKACTAAGIRRELRDIPSDCELADRKNLKASLELCRRDPGHRPGQTRHTMEALRVSTLPFVRLSGQERLGFVAMK